MWNHQVLPDEVQLKFVIDNNYHVHCTHSSYPVNDRKQF